MGLSNSLKEEHEALFSRKFMSKKAGFLQKKVAFFHKYIFCKKNRFFLHKKAAFFTKMNFCKKAVFFYNRSICKRKQDFCIKKQFFTQYISVKKAVFFVFFIFILLFFFFRKVLVRFHF